MSARNKLSLLADRGPLRVLFMTTSMPVGGAETLLVNLIRGLDRSRFIPLLCCTKELGPLGEELAGEIKTYHGLLRSKYDLRVLPRLMRLMRAERIDAVVTVGAGDKMFWGRLAAWRAGVPVVLSALHSTGWPDGLGRLNRLLTPLTDAVIGVAAPHGRYLVEVEKFPPDKVRVIPNGINVNRFQPRADRERVRSSLGLGPQNQAVGIVAALRPEKNHELFLQTAAMLRTRHPQAKFLIIGDGPQRAKLETLASELHLGDAVQFLGTRADVPELVSALDVFMLTSHVEASPVSILEALACGTPVVATRVGSIAESVIEGETGFLALPGDAQALAQAAGRLLADPQLAQQMGRAGRRQVIAHGSLQTMIAGYENLLEEVYRFKSGETRTPETRSLCAALPADTAAG